MISEEKFNLKPVIITGANGFTGRFVCKELLKRNVRFLALLRPKTEIDWFRKHSVKVIFADLNDFDQLCSVLHQGRALVNVASIGFGAAPIIVNACKKIGIKRVVFVSTTAIFTKLNSKSKSIRINAEDYIVKSKLDYTILRPTMIYGNNKDRNLIRLIDWIRKYPFIPIFNRGVALQQPIYVGDVAWAVVSSLLNPNSINQIFNISGAHPVSFNEMINIISKKMNKRVLKISVNSEFATFVIKIFNIINVKLPISEEQICRVIENKSFSNNMAKEIIDFEPLSFEEGISREINEYLM